MRATFNLFELEMTREQASSASQPGKNASEDVAELLKIRKIVSQLDKIGAEKIRAELYTYGAWDDEALKDDQANRGRIVWIAAGDIAEGK